MRLRAFVKHTCLLHMNVCAELCVLSVFVASACHSYDCKVSDLWFSSKMQQENLITLQKEREREKERGKEGAESETWDNWTELPLKPLAAGFMSSACGAYLQYVLSSWPYIESGTIRQPWYKYWVETCWQLKLWPKCWNYVQRWWVFLRSKRENKTNEVTIIFL